MFYFCEIFSVSLVSIEWVPLVPGATGAWHLWIFQNDTFVPNTSGKNDNLSVFLGKKLIFLLVGTCRFQANAPALAYDFLQLRLGA